MIEEGKFMDIRTDRLLIRTAGEEDTHFFLQLWTDPGAMQFVGFPHGLLITEAEVRSKLKSQCDSLLTVTLIDTGAAIGECSIHPPDSEGIARTDVKLLPAFWGNRYGIEIKKALLGYLFTNTLCSAVQATPNVNNVASIKMQEAVGGIRIGEGVYRFPVEMESYTVPVHHYIYQVTRECWERLNSGTPDRY